MSTTTVQDGTDIKAPPAAVQLPDRGRVLMGALLKALSYASLPVALDRLTFHMPVLPLLVEPAPIQDPALVAVGDLLEDTDDYVGRHRDERPAVWQPAHTQAAGLSRYRARHARAHDERPDLRIEHTSELDLDQLDQMLCRVSPC